MERIPWTVDDLAEKTTKRLRAMKHWREVGLGHHQANLAAGEVIYPSGYAVQTVIEIEQTSLAAIDAELARRVDNP